MRRASRSRWPVAKSMVLAGMVALCAAPDDAQAQGKPGTPYDVADRWIQANADTLRGINQRIWSRPELGLQETFATEQLATLLEREGFTVERGVAGMPTAFVATAGSGSPVIGFLAEYDALPGMSQAAAPERRPRQSGGAASDAGHACGHSVFGVGSTAAAIAASKALARNAAGLTGTIRLYGTPAEETGIGKVYMARAGLFDDLDVALHWHASDKTLVRFETNKAVVSVKYRYGGLSSHASMSPHAGRSALDAVELMNVGANYLREHLKDDARMHYVITDGGGQPNVVPATASVWYYLRADSHGDVERMLARLRDIAQGAALMTWTTVEEQIDTDLYELLPNRPLSEVLQRHLERVGPPQFNDEERRFAQRTQADLTDPPKEPLFSGIQPLAKTPIRTPASTDVGNVSWLVPTSGIDVACYTNGAPGHSWQIVACTGMSIGEKGMIVAARTLAGAAVEFCVKKAHVEAAKRDFEERRANATVPTSLLAADQKAPKQIR